MPCSAVIFLDFALLYPSAFLCLASLWEKLRTPRRTACIAAGCITLLCIGCAPRGGGVGAQHNSPPPPPPWSSPCGGGGGGGGHARKPHRFPPLFFSISAVMMAVCSLLSTLLNAHTEISNPQTVCLASTALLRLGLAAMLTVLFWFTAVQWSRWLLREYSGEAFWQSAWPLLALYAVFLVYCMPLNPAVVLVGRLKIISVLAVSISLFGIFLLLYEMYRVAREFTRNARLDRENQLLAMESRRYMELQTYLDNTRRLRHDFRQHLHVIAGLTETGQLEELKSYLHQYESELSEHRPSLCANAAVDALAGYYDHAAGQQSVPVEWKLALPRQLPMPEADLCTILGNLLENALHASQKLPPEQRRVQVMAQMLSPAMLGLVVENRYDGMLKKQQGILHSTKHEGTGIGLVSAETVVHKYNGNLHLETEEQIFRVNVLLNL